MLSDAPHPLQGLCVRLTSSHMCACSVAQRDLMVLLDIACTLLHGHGRCVEAVVLLVLPLVSKVGELCLNCA